MARVNSEGAGSGSGERDVICGGGTDADEQIRALLMADSYKGLSIKRVGGGGFTEFEYEPKRSAAGGGITGSGIEEVLVSQVLSIDEQEALRLMRHG